MYDISTDRADESENFWTIPDAPDDLEASEQPRVYYETPDGREYRDYRRLSARFEDHRREFIREELERLEADLSADEALAIASTQAYADDQETPEDILEGIDDEDLEAVNRIRWSRLAMPDDVLAGYLEFVRPHITGLTNIGKDGQSIRWGDDGQLIELFEAKLRADHLGEDDERTLEDVPNGRLADRARDYILLSLGPPARREGNLRDLAASVAQGLSEDQKKD